MRVPNKGRWAHDNVTLLHVYRIEPVVWVWVDKTQGCHPGQPSPRARSIQASGPQVVTPSPQASFGDGFNQSSTQISYLCYNYHPTPDIMLKTMESCKGLLIIFLVHPIHGITVVNDDISIVGYKQISCSKHQDTIVECPKCFSIKSCAQI